ncbi:hypothetical protein HPB51_007508 [Rhipicephalus microplus]|uniref:Uncharacterized protein n=1 Tax=Rhipicephalus microplus TaxID=6941 RepID=A0A9J6E0B2_RHIMP|nr:hypothetical protein HPB51_007508 [Rhipicephalus microplus]
MTRPPVQQEQQVEAAPPQQRGKSIAERSKKVSLRHPPLLRRCTQAMPVNDRPLCGSEKRAQAMAPGYAGSVSTSGKPAGPSSGKPTRETKNVYLQPNADDRGPKPFVTLKEQEGIVQNPVIPDATSRRWSRYPGRGNEGAAQGADIKSTPKKIPSNHCRHRSQAVARALDLQPWSAPRKEAAALPLPRAAYPAKLYGVKKGMPTRPKPGTPIRSADFSLLVDEADEPTSTPGRKTNQNVTKEVRGSIAKPPLLFPSARPSRASPSRGVFLPVKPTNVNGAMYRPIHDLKERATVPHDSRRQDQSKTVDVLADMRGLTKASVVSKFDPFRQPSILVSGVGASGLGLETTPVPRCNRIKQLQQARSSFPALKHLSRLYDHNEPKQPLYFPEAERIIAMQRVATLPGGFCSVSYTGLAEPISRGTGLRMRNYTPPPQRAARHRCARTSMRCADDQWCDAPEPAPLSHSAAAARDSPPQVCAFQRSAVIALVDIWTPTPAPSLCSRHLTLRWSHLIAPLLAFATVV